MVFSLGVPKRTEELRRGRLSCVWSTVGCNCRDDRGGLAVSRDEDDENDDAVWAVDGVDVEDGGLLGFVLDRDSEDSTGEILKGLGSTPPEGE